MADAVTVNGMQTGVRAGRPRRRWLVLALQIAFAAWLVYMVGGSLWQLNADAKWSPPHEVAGLSLTKTTTGEQAVHEMTQLHGKDVSLLDGYVAHYAGQGAEAVLYVGQAADVATAASLNERMVALIARGNSPFRGLREVEMDGRRLYGVSGLGAEHYFYQINDKIVWLQVAGTDPEAALRAVFAKVS